MIRLTPICLILSLLMACEESPPEKTVVSCLHDETDSMHAVVDALCILDLFRFDENPLNAGEFRLSDITDVSMNPTHVIRIDAEEKWNSNQFKRERSIAAFSDSVATMINNAISFTGGKPQSSVYLPIARELRYLAETSAERRILIVSSDLMEHQPGMSFYDKTTFALLTQNSDSLEQLLEHKAPLPSLDGIKVYFIYQPTDTYHDQQYQVVSTFYKNMLEQKGATVSITANLTR